MEPSVAMREYYVVNRRLRNGDQLQCSHSCQKKDLFTIKKIGNYGGMFFMGEGD